MDFRIPDTAIATILERSKAFTLDGAWLVTKTDGAIIRMHVRRHWPSEEKQVYATDFLNRATKELDFEGSWVAGWTDWSLQAADYTRFFVMFLDRDGDTRFQIDFDQDPWPVMVMAVDDYLEQCADAHRQWKEHMAAVEVAPSQIYHPHQGERSRDISDMPIDPLEGLQ